jgi:hypothetical protein
LQDGIFYRCLSGPLNLCCHSVLKFLCWFFVWISIDDRGVLKSPAISISGSICVLKSSSICLMKLGALTLSTYKSTVVISSWCISPFITMKWPSLSLLTNLGLKSTLSDISIATTACFEEPLANIFLLFHLKPMFVSSIRWVACKQQIIRCSFLIQFQAHVL